MAKKCLRPNICYNREVKYSLKYFFTSSVNSYESNCARGKRRRKYLLNKESSYIFVDQLYNQIGGVVKYIYFNKTTAFEWSRNCIYVLLFLHVEIIVPNNIKTYIVKQNRKQLLFISSVAKFHSIFDVNALQIDCRM